MLNSSNDKSKLWPDHFFKKKLGKDLEFRQEVPLSYLARAQNSDLVRGHLLLIADGSRAGSQFHHIPEF
jgi:hypothetical protein